MSPSVTSSGNSGRVCCADMSSLLLFFYCLGGIFLVGCQAPTRRRRHCHRRHRPASPLPPHCHTQHTHTAAAHPHPHAHTEALIRTAASASGLSRRISRRASVVIMKSSSLRLISLGSLQVLDAEYDAKPCPSMRLS